MNETQRQQIRTIVLEAVKRGDNPWNAVFNASPELYDRHVVSDALFYWQREGMIIYSVEYGYQAKEKSNG
jgi:hypothetical protein